MKNFSLKILMSACILALAGIVLWSTGTPVFATLNDGYYTGNFTPNGCDPNTMSVVDVGPADFVAPFSLGSSTIYVLSGGTYTITQDIAMANCSVFVVATGTAVNAIFNFQGGKYFSSNGASNFMIAGLGTHKIEINNGATSPMGIYAKNGSGITLSGLILSGFSPYYGIYLEDIHNSYITNVTGGNITGRGLFLASSTGNTIFGNVIFNTTNGISLGSNSDNNIVSNTKVIVSSYGIKIEGIGNHIISNNISGAQAGLYIDTASGTIISGNIISHNSIYGVYLGNGSSNTFSSNSITNNPEGIFGDNTNANTFNSNIITSNVKGIRLETCSGNTFTNDTISSNTSKNIEINYSDYNQFTNTTIQSSLIGIESSNSNYNTFSGVNVSSNTSGIILTTSLNNTLRLVNNTNGIALYGGANNNNILNTQIVGQNNIFIYDGSSNNIVTGGIFAAASTTSPSVTLALKINTANPRTYNIAGAGLSGTYSGAVATGSVLSLPVTLSAGYATKNILVTYDNGNTYYDSISYTSPGNGGSPGGGGGGMGTPLCTSVNLVCSGGVYVLKTGAMCQGGNLGGSCTLQTGTQHLTGSIIGSPFSAELNNAYLRAYSLGITTMPTIQQAKMTGTLIRAHMAKMMSNFAIKVAGRTPNTSLECNFTDIASQSAEMKFYIKLSCQLGLMGLKPDGTPDTVFSPKSDVTRAQFGTVLSRLIRGDTYNIGLPYYAAHLNALHTTTPPIMKDISDPKTKEKRGYVMLMMQRTFSGGFLSGSN